jgi:hypothetical protein
MPSKKKKRKQRAAAATNAQATSAPSGTALVSTSATREQRRSNPDGPHRGGGRSAAAQRSDLDFERWLTDRSRADADVLDADTAPAVVVGEAVVLLGLERANMNGLRGTGGDHTHACTVLS